MFCEFLPESKTCDVVSDCAKNAENRSEQVDQVGLQNAFVYEITEIISPGELFLHN